MAARGKRIYMYSEEIYQTLEQLQATPELFLLTDATGAIRWKPSDLDVTNMRHMHILADLLDRRRLIISRICNVRTLRRPGPAVVQMDPMTVPPRVRPFVTVLQLQRWQHGWYTFADFQCPVSPPQPCPSAEDAARIRAWMQQSRRWVFCSLLGNAAQVRQLLHHAGLSEHQELVVEKYLEHNLWCLEWWTLQRYVGNEEQTALLENCLKHGAIRLFVLGGEGRLAI